MKALWRGLVLLLGLGLFGWYLSQVGFSQVWEAAQRLGFYAPLLLVPYLVVYGVDTVAWAQTLPRKDLSFLALLRIRWAGESVNNVLPSAYVGGEAVKVCMLQAQGIGAAEATTAAVVSKTAQTVAQLLFVLLAALVLLGLARHQAGLAAGVLFVVLCGTVAVGGLFWVQKVGFFRTGYALLETLRCSPSFLQQRRAKLLQLDETILDFYRAHPGSFYASTALYLAGWLLDTVEIYLVGNCLGLPISWPQALVVEAFTGIAKAVGMWIPGSLGVQESGIVLIGRVASLPDPLIATYPFIRRAREVVFSAAGLGLLYSGSALRKTPTVKPVTQ